MNDSLKLKNLLIPTIPTLTVLLTIALAITFLAFRIEERGVHFPGAINAGILQSNEDAVVAILVDNPTDEEHVIFGAETTCMCIAPKDLPIRLPPHSKTQVKCVLRTGSRAERLSQSVRFFHGKDRLVVDRVDILADVAERTQRRLSTP